MSTGIETTFDRTFTTGELDALEDEFDHRVWRAGSEEPDARVTVLYDETERGIARWLVRVGAAWAWASPYGDPATPDPWDAIQGWMGRSGRVLRIPDRKELMDGGWTIVDPEHSGDDEPMPDEAKEQLDAGFQALGQFGFRSDNTQNLKAQAHFMASIAISLHELVALHKKYDPESMEIVVDPGPAVGPGDLPVENQDFETKAAAEPENVPAPGSMGSEDFPFAR